MALVVKDRVQETSTTTGTGTFTLAGAVSGFQSFSAIGNGNTTYYTITDGTNWEVGIGTYTLSGTTLSRDTVLKSSNSNNLVDFGAGSKFVFCTYPADKSVYADASSKVSGYVIENSTIGATTASTGTFTSVTTPSVTATTTDLTLSAISTGAVKFNTLAGTKVQITDATSANGQYTLLSRNDAVNEQRVSAEATSGGVNLGFSSLAAGGAVKFYTNGFAQQQLQVSHTASAVNYVQVTGGATGNSPVISAQGSDAAVALSITSKSTNAIRFLSNNAANLQFRIVGTNTAVNNLAVTGTIATNAPSLSSEGSDTNISMAFQPKGTGAIDLAAGSSGVNISNGGTVTAITRTASGSAYTSFPSIAITAPTTAGGVQATASVASMGVNAGTVASGGTGYTVGDVLTVVGGTPVGGAATLTVTAVSGGVITSVSSTNFLTYTVLPANPVSVTGGTGSSATLNLTYFVPASFTITAAGSGYIEQPTITFSGGGGSGASAFASVGALPIVKSLHTEMQFSTAAGIGFEVQTYGAGTTTSRFATFASSSGNPAVLEPRGAAGNIASLFSSKGTSALQFYTNSFTLGTGAQQLAVSHTASAVNYVQVTGAVTGTATIPRAPILSAQGSDTNISMALLPKGTGIVYTNQIAPVAYDATNTLLIADILSQIITTTSATAVSLTLPTGTLTDAGILGGTGAVNTAFEWSIVNLGSAVGAITLVAGTAHTIVGSTAIAVGASARLKTRKTASNTYITYRIA